MSFTVIAPTPSTTVPIDANVIRGAARVSYAAYVAPTTGTPNNATFTSGYLGQLANGGVSINQAIDYGFIDGEEQLTPSDAFLTKEALDITLTLNETPIETYNLIMGAHTANVVASAGLKSMGLGGTHTSQTDMRPNFYQVLIQTSDEGSSPIGGGGAGTGLTGFWQLWKCIFAPAGAMTYSRDKHATLPIKILVYRDWLVTPVLGEYSRIGRRIINAT